MIVEWFLGVITTLLEAMIGALPEFDVPGWLTSAGGAVAEVLSSAGAMSYWLPFDVLVPVAVTVLAAYAVGLAIKLARIVLSFFTAGGGSAG